MNILKKSNEQLYKWFAIHPVKLTNRRDRMEFGMSEFKNSTDWYLFKYGHLMAEAKRDLKYYMRHYGKLVKVG
jgi:hypothetical protein